ncbi:MAG: hypothetical protein WD066_10235 [Planctomycetaceae bacterium]
MASESNARKSAADASPSLADARATAAKKPARGRRWLRGVVWILAVWIVAEILAAIALWWLDGGLSIAALHRAQFAAAHPLEVSTGSTRFVGGDHRVVVGTLERPADFVAGDNIPHPYIGFVFDPRSELRPEPINEFGLFGKDSPVRKKSPDKFIVGLMGGSIAYGVSQAGAEALAEALAKSPRLAGREVVVVPLAIPAYKQPQPLLLVNYLLTLGAEFDALVLLDGVNDVVHASHQLRFVEQSPGFPLAWPDRLKMFRDPPRGATANEQARRDWAMTFRNLPAAISWSPLVNLTWRVWDGSLAREAESKSRGASGGPSEFVFTGPRAEFDPDDEGALFDDLADYWKRGSLQLAQVCRANGIEYHHFLQPNQYVELKVNPLHEGDPPPGDASKPMGEAERSWAFASEHPFRDAVRKGYPRLWRGGLELREQGVNFHDLTPLFADVEEPIYVDSCCYMNQRGNETIGTAIGEALGAAADSDEP